MNNLTNLNGNQTEMASQFSSLLSLQRSNQEVLQKQSSTLSSSDILSNYGDERQTKSADVVCAFLKKHSDIVAKLKESNQIMYANIITDDKYAAQFLKKMLQSGNEDYRNEISAIVQEQQTH